MRSILKLPTYRHLLAAYALNELAVTIGSLALAVLVYRRTGSAFGAAGFFLSSQFVPALLSPALVARLDQRSLGRVLPILYGLETIVFLALAGVASRFALAPVLALAVVDGVLALAARALARTATVAVTAPAGLLRAGNAVNNAAFSVCFMAGPAIGGAIVATGGTVAALLAGSGLFALIALTLATASGIPDAKRDEDTASGRLRAALAHAVQRPAIRVLLGLQAIALVFFTISIPVEVVFASRSLHAGAGGYGGLLSAWGGGAIAGSAIYARWRAWPPRAMISLGAAALGVGFGVMAAAPNLVVALVGAALGGCGNGIEAVSARTTLQEHVEPRWMAMMMSLNESLFQALPGVGIVLGGGIAAAAGPRVALAVASGGALAVTAAAWVLLGPGGALREPPPSTVEGEERRRRHTPTPLAHSQSAAGPTKR